MHMNMHYVYDEYVHVIIMTVGAVLVVTVCVATFWSKNQSQLLVCVCYVTVQPASSNRA